MKPLLLTKETKRNHNQNDLKKPYTYDYNTDMNMYNGKLFIEEASFNDRELLTKTEADRERDDEETFIDTETSENADRKTTVAFLEMISKTFADRESDDEDDSYYYK